MWVWHGRLGHLYYGMSMFMASIEPTNAISTAAEDTLPDIVVLRLEVDDLCTLPECSADLVYNYKMAAQGTRYSIDVSMGILLSSSCLLLMWHRFP